MVNASDRHPRYFAVIVAAGKGTRFGADVPKQFLPLCGKPVLCRSIDAFRACPDTEVVLVLSDTGRDMWLDLCRLHCIDSPRIVIGGDSRSESVHNALRAIAPELTTESVVMVHDGARPMLTPGFISRIAREFDRPDVDSAVPVMPLTESLCMADGDAAVRPVDRSLYRSVQTPRPSGPSVSSKPMTRSTAASCRTMPRYSPHIPAARSTPSQALRTISRSLTHATST